MVGYSIWMTPSKEELAARQRKQDSIAQLIKMRNDSIAKTQAVQKKEEKPVAQTKQIAEPEKREENIIASDKYNDLQQKFGVFANSSKGTDTAFTIENDLIKLKISKKGGYVKSVELKDYKTYDSLPVILYDENTSKFGISFFMGNRAINTADFYFEPVSKINSVSGDNENVFRFRLYTDASEDVYDTTKYIEFAYKLKGNDYMLGFDVNFVNMEGLISSNASYVEIDWHVDLRQQEKSVDRFNGSTIYYKYYKDDVDYLSETSDDEEKIKTKLKWTSFKQRFFSSTLIAENFFQDGILKTYTLKESTIPRYLKSMDVSLSVPYRNGITKTIPMKLFFGPNKFTLLRSYGLDLERQIPIGWSFFLLAWINEWIVIPVFNWLGSYGWNYGIVILILTILLKIFLLPIAYKTYMSSAKMRVLKPEVDAINAKYPKKEDAMKKQQAIMALYKKAGANPASGCVPMLLQMPILFAMFRFFPASIELRQQSFLWAHDLSSYDSILQLPWNIPFYGDHVSLFTLLMTASTIMYTYVNNQMMGQQTQTMPGMKTMMYLMPIMFLGLFNNYASGLSYYYFLANIITFFQMWLFRKLINEDKLRKKIEAAKKKPVKKSALQKRLEEAAKKRGYPTR
jgi:YidC/Oxa1 family membrane protein insertase